MAKSLEMAAWLAGTISSDGHVSIETHSPAVIISVGPKERPWADQIKSIVEENSDLHVSIFGPYNNHCYHLTIAPVRRCYELLKPVQHLMMPRKWKRLEIYFESFAPRPGRQEAYDYVARRISRGVPIATAAKEAGVKFNVPWDSITNWFYNGVRPKLYPATDWKERARAIA